jgi:hypothetical protein
MGQQGFRFSYPKRRNVPGDSQSYPRNPFVHSLLVTSGNPSVTMQWMTPGSTIGLVRRVLIEL